MIKATSNVNELIAGMLTKLNGYQKGGEGYSTVLREVATTMRGEMGRRIHSEGKNANDSKIGDYSTKPIYVSISDNPGRSFGRPIGKTGRSVFKSTGKDHKSRYFEGGYSQFKTAIGRNQLGSVNLSLSGQMANQFSVVATADGYGLGWADTEKLERAKHLENKYGKVWGLTEGEKELANEIIADHFKQIFN